MAQEYTPKELKEWKAAKDIWLTANIDLPVKQTVEHIHFLDDLRQVALTYRAAKEATVDDRKDKTNLIAIADQCRDLADALAMETRHHHYTPLSNLEILLGIIGNPLSDNRNELLWQFNEVGKWLNLIPC